MKVVTGPEGWPEASDYTVAERFVRFNADDKPIRPILNLNLFNPINDYYGMAPIVSQVSFKCMSVSTYRVGPTSARPCKRTWSSASIGVTKCRS